MSQQPPRINVDTNFDVEIKHLNDMQLIHNPHEFVMTLSQMIPEFDATGQLKGFNKKAIGRFSMSPAFAKIMAGVLNTNLQRYEEQFGDIVTDIPPNSQ